MLTDRQREQVIEKFFPDWEAEDAYPRHNCEAVIVNEEEVSAFFIGAFGPPYSFSEVRDFAIKLYESLDRDSPILFTAHRNFDALANIHCCDIILLVAKLNGEIVVSHEESNRLQKIFSSSVIPEDVRSEDLLILDNLALERALEMHIAEETRLVAQYEGDDRNKHLIARRAQLHIKSAKQILESP
jgi:hypothetical protein